VCFDGAVIAAGAHVQCSIVGRGARIEAGAVVTDLSVVGDAAVVPAGAHVAAGRVPALTP
jgi:NDP-sugar pyrophosphorylase family protein